MRHTKSRTPRESTDSVSVRLTARKAETLGTNVATSVGVTPARSSIRLRSHNWRTNAYDRRST